MRSNLGISSTLGHLLLCLQISYGYENLSTGRTTSTWMSSVFRQNLYPVQGSVDGSFDRLTASQRSCAISGDGQLEATWGIDLGDIRSIKSVKIYYRNEDPRNWDNVLRGRFAGFFLYASNTTSKEDGYLCYHELQNGTNSPPPIFTVECVAHARYIIYYNERKPGITYPSYYYMDAVFIELCEVVVRGCSNPGVYGENCNISCPANCQENRCWIVNGTCLGCKDGYTGITCDKKCPDQLYGPECSKTCGKCLNEIPCHHVNGSCLNGCSAGYKLGKCITPCDLSKYGLQCKETCNVNCKTTRVCNYISGACDGGCKDGFQGDRCDRECDSNMYGANCNTQCGICVGHSQCHHINGSCLTGCDKGFKGDKCTTECEPTKYGEDCRYNCSLECVNQTCISQTGVCIQSLIHNMVLESSSVVPIIVGVLAAVVVIAIAILTVVLLLKRTRTGKDSSGDRKLKETSKMKDIDSHGISNKTQKVNNNKQKLEQSTTESQTVPNSSGKLMTSTKGAFAADELDNNVYQELHEEGLYDRQYASCANYSDISDIEIDNLGDVIKEMSKDDMERFKAAHREEYNIFTHALSAHIQNRTKDVYYNL